MSVIEALYKYLNESQDYLADAGGTSNNLLYNLNLAMIDIFNCFHHANA